jgi:hypothetical protein
MIVISLKSRTILAPGRLTDPAVIGELIGVAERVRGGVAPALAAVADVVPLFRPARRE